MAAGITPPTPGAGIRNDGRTPKTPCDPLPVLQVPRFPIVAGLAAAAVGVTMASKCDVNVSALYDSPAIGRGEVWRLLTSILPHGGPFHLIFNVYWLWVFGSLVEESFGQWKNFALIVLLALGSGAAEYAFLDGGIGLSGVVYGLFGMVWVLSRYPPRFRDAVDANTAIMFVAWFFLCIVTTATGFSRWPTSPTGSGRSWASWSGSPSPARAWQVAPPAPARPS